MLQVTINGERRALPADVSIADLIDEMGYDRRRIAVELNREVVPLARHGELRVTDGDTVEIVRLVGGGADENEKVCAPSDKPLTIGKFTFQSRLITGTGKYATYDLMRDCLLASGCEVTTVAVRRERLVDKEGPQHPRLPRPEALHDPAEHGRLLQRRGRHPPRPAGPRAADEPRQPRRRMGQAGMPGRPEDAAARSGRDTAGDGAAGQGGLPGAGLHQRRPDHGPAAEGSRGGQRHAGRQPHRQRARAFSTRTTSASFWSI